MIDASLVIWWVGLKDVCSEGRGIEWEIWMAKSSPTMRAKYQATSLAQIMLASEKDAPTSLLFIGSQFTHDLSFGCDAAE